ncbi:capsular polysaccharide export protein, LipB/KpsS family [Labrys neptuniae]
MGTKSDQPDVVVEFPFVPREASRPQVKPLVILLQGPVGPFFKVLASTLKAAGFDVLKINFNGGDWLYSSGQDTLNFCGSTADWASWLESLLEGRRPHAIALFGDSRPYHKQAIGVAQRNGIRVLAFEEGYLRPDFITCEWGGNNALSPLRGQPLTQLPAEPVETFQPIKANLFRAMAGLAIGYYLAAAAGAVFFQGNLRHRKRSLWSESVLWTRNYYRKLRYYAANSRSMLDLIENYEARYFVVALQVHDDQQLLRHGKGWTMERLIIESISSFRRHADPEHHLVIKVHPMDRGHKSYRSFVRDQAKLSDCGDRVHVIDDGSIGLLIRHSLGLVTVNSTSGLLALNHNKPLIALGDALYNYPALLPDNGCAGRAGLDQFWRARPSAVPEAVEAFKARMRESSLVNGSFYIRGVMEETCRRIAKRIQEARDVREAPSINVKPALPVPLHYGTSTARLSLVPADKPERFS